MTTSDEKYYHHSSSFTNYAFGSVFVYFFTKTIKSFFLVGHNYATEKMLVRKYGPGFIKHPSLAVSSLLDGFLGMIDNMNETNALTNLAILAFQNFFSTRQVYLLGQGSLNIYAVICFGIIGLVASMTYISSKYFYVFRNKEEINYTTTLWTVGKSYILYMMILSFGIYTVFVFTFPDVVIIFDPFKAKELDNHFRLGFLSMIGIILLGSAFLSFVFAINILFFRQGGPVARSLNNAMIYSHASVILRCNLFLNYQQIFTRN